jgi:hypothetical protein
MVAKSRPRRRTVIETSPIEPADWPDWVLGPRGTTSLDPVRAAVLRSEFHQFQRDRDAWFVDNGIAYSWHACYNEHRRRAAVWQADHPEDVGPTFRTTPKA